MRDFKARYFYRFGAKHVARVGKSETWQRFFWAVESQDHFDRQAEHFGNFEQTLEDLETYCLPAIIELCDWNRFVHYSLIAANLHGLAEALADEGVLESLTRHRRLTLAESLVDRLHDPIRRARGRTAIAGALDRDQPAFSRLLDGLHQDLDSVSSPVDRETAEIWCGALETVARQFALDLQNRWKAWIERLKKWEGLPGRAWRAVVEGLIESGTLDDPYLWRAIKSIDDIEYLRVTLPHRLAAWRLDEPWPLFEKIRKIKPNGELMCWPICAAVLGQLPPIHAVRLWNEALARWDSVIWDLKLVEAGRELWPKLPRTELLGTIVDPTVRAALEIELLSEFPDDCSLVAIIKILNGVPKTPEQLHLTLRYLPSLTQDSTTELRNYVASITDYVASLRYTLNTSDLCRFLELIAMIFPQQLRRQVQEVLWAPGTNAETLRTLAREARTPQLLEELLEQVERYPYTVTASETEAFDLWLEVLMTFTPRLCVMRQELSGLEEAAERLPPEEKDTLRVAVADAMGAIGRADLAREASSRMRSPQLRLRTRLTTAIGPEIEELLVPGTLYAAYANAGAIGDEFHALEALLDLPVDIVTLTDLSLKPIRNQRRYVQAVLDLAWHSLHFQQRCFEPRRRDLQSPMNVVRKAFGGKIESKAWLSALTPELVDLGSQLGPNQAVSEFKEAWECLLSQTSTEWSLREESFEMLLARLKSFVSEVPDELSNARCRAASKIIEWLPVLPRTLGDTSKDIPKYWQRIFPLVIATLEQLPSCVAAYLRHPWRSRLWSNNRKMSEDHPESLNAWFRRKLRPRLVDLNFALSGERRPGLLPTQDPILDLCFASVTERLRRAEELLEAPQPNQDLLHALIYLLAVDAPDLIPHLVSRVQPHEDRDRLILNFIKNKWQPLVAATLVESISPTHYHHGKVWLNVDKGSREDQWVDSIRQMISRAELDADDPRSFELRRRLWSLNQRCLPMFAKATVAALAAGGREGGEHGLRLFINCLIAPGFGRDGSDRQRSKIGGLRLASRRALSLAGT